MGRAWREAVPAVGEPGRGHICGRRQPSRLAGLRILPVALLLAVISIGLGSLGAATAADCSTTIYLDGGPSLVVESASAKIVITDIAAIRGARWDVFAQSGYSLQSVEVHINGSRDVNSTAAHGVTGQESFVSRIEAISCPEATATTVPPTTSVPTTTQPTTTSSSSTTTTTTTPSTPPLCPIRVELFPPNNASGDLDKIDVMWTLGPPDPRERVILRPIGQRVLCHAEATGSDGVTQSSTDPKNASLLVNGRVVTGYATARDLPTTTTSTTTTTAPTTTALPPGGGFIRFVQALIQSLNLPAAFTEPLTALLRLLLLFE